MQQTTSLNFSNGQQVIDKSNPSQIGIFTGNRRQAGKIEMLELEFPNGETKYRPQHALELVDSNLTSTLRDQVKAKRFGRLSDLTRLITYEKLKGTLQEVIYSMEAAQIDFYPYQFKPVLKFIDSPTERMILADEVGLGKTIESGLIWMEMQARYRATRLLVICPKILSEKWSEELKNKFQLDAKIVNFNELQHEINELKKHGANYPFTLIGTYSGLRPPKASRSELKIPPEDGPSNSSKAQLLRELRFWGEDYPPIDMVIFDEAHYMRNQATTTFHLGESIASSARAVLCVSATPVNNSNIDLHSLLRLVDEEFFSTQSVFDDLILANKPAVHASNILMKSPVDTNALFTTVQKMAESNYLQESPLLKQFIEQLQALAEADFTDAQKLAIAQDTAEKLNILGNYINRTRRVQVKENRPKRDPQVIPVNYSPEEMALYQAILKIVRGKCRINKKPFHVFQVMTLQLMAASCLPAFSNRILNEDIEKQEHLLQEAFGTLDGDHSKLDTKEVSNTLSDLLGYDFEKNDSKFDQLIQVVKAKPKEKIIIFAYYRPTLAYLKKRLTEAGEKVAVIHGGINIEKRWAEIENFKKQNGPRILLASEVGSEGIDLQFCRILINYDLPWNPMRVEQRIGRIDRVGQKANRLSIIHFKVTGTIEERIHDKLHHKLEQFSSSLGDLDEVIGNEVKQLAVELLSNDLTPEEENEKISQTEQALSNKLIHFKQLEESGDALVALSDYVQKKVEEDKGKGRYIQPSELLTYVSDFFSRHFRGTELNYNTPKEGCLQIQFSDEAFESLNAFIHDDRSISAQPFRQRLITITFKREVRQSLTRVEQRNVHFVNHLSPLIRWITKLNKRKDHELYKLSAISAKTSLLPPGIYTYRIERWQMRGLKNVEKLAYGIASLDGNQSYSTHESEPIFNTLLTAGTDWDYYKIDSEILLKQYDLLEDYLFEQFSDAITQFEIENDSTLQIKEHRVRNIFDRRIEQDQRRLETLIHAGREEKVLRMARGRLEKAKENKQKKLSELKLKSNVDPESSPIAVGIINIEA